MPQIAVFQLSKFMQVRRTHFLPQRISARSSHMVRTDLAVPNMLQQQVLQVTQTQPDTGIKPTLSLLAGF
jgi:hypothetical protein